MGAEGLSVRSAHAEVGKAWQTVSWLVLREATEEATKIARCRCVARTTLNVERESEPEQDQRIAAEVTEKRRQGAAASRSGDASSNSPSLEGHSERHCEVAADDRAMFPS